MPRTYRFRNHRLSYAELHCNSNFSFLEGASHPGELVQRAAELGYCALALTDRHSLAGVVRAHVEAKKLQQDNIPFKLLIGSVFTTEEGLRFIMLAPDRHAYGQLTTLITRARRRSKKGQYRLHVSDLQPATDGCLFIWLPGLDQAALPATDSGIADRPLTSGLQLDLESLHTACRAFIKITQGRLWIGLTHNMNSSDTFLGVDSAAQPPELC